MKIEILNPLHIENWDDKIAHFNEVTIFHTSMWAKVLTETYHYTPQYLVGYRDSQLVALMPLMEIASPFTGKRGISLPFTDVCPILALEEKDKIRLWEKANDLAKANQWQTLESRSNHLFEPTIPVSTQFYEHQVILDEDPEKLFSRMKSSTRRNIRKAEQSEVTIKHLQSLDAVKTFYQLHSKTRKRHGMPIQPWNFFKNIWTHILSNNYGFISIAYHNTQAIASSVYFHFEKSALYKFGASDLSFQNVRPNDFIQWDAIKHFQSRGFKSLSLGRTDWGHEGLRRYKLGLGTEESIIQYHKYDFKKNTFIETDPEKEGTGFHLKNAPIIALKMIGKFAYKHAA